MIKAIRRKSHRKVASRGFTSTSSGLVTGPAVADVASCRLESSLLMATSLMATPLVAPRPPPRGLTIVLYASADTPSAATAAAVPPRIAAQ